MAADLPNVATLNLNISAFENLPLGILHLIFANLDTAQSLARVSQASKKLHRLVHATGYRAFVRAHFGSLTLQTGLRDEQWAGLARRLTWQSRAWDKRAFSVASLVPPTKKPQGSNPRGGGGGRGGRRQRQAQPRMQSFPPQVVVDAAASLHGQAENETVAWGIGEDVVVRWRGLKRSVLKKEKWKAIEGSKVGFRAGDDDVTALSILSDSLTESKLLVGRASGNLQLISTARDDFGEAKASFQPVAEGGEKPTVRQNDVQHFDVNRSRDTIAAVTKDGILLYPLNEASSNTESDDTATVPVVEPRETLDVRGMAGPDEFRYLRGAKFLPNGDLAVCMNGSKQPLRHLQRTPTGTVMASAAKMLPSDRCASSYISSNDRLQNARALLPVNTSSMAGGSGYSILSSYDDGTVRLQDLRTPSAIDTIYQDHFELATPVGPLLAHGTERFVAGCARTEVLKIFDFRWTKSYSYTDATPCSREPLGPEPKPLTWTPVPRATERDACVYLSGHTCARHALARTDFYRPNGILYLPTMYPSSSPVYSLAKSSDESATVYAGLTAELAEVSLQDPGEVVAGRGFSTLKMGKHRRCGYDYVEHKTSIVETGDGIALSDVTKSQRMPNIYKQTGERSRASVRKVPQRLDDLLL